MSNKLEKAVRNPSLAYAKRKGFKLSTAPLRELDLNDFVGVHKRMHFGNGAAGGWPDDLFVFSGGHNWWVEFKGEEGAASALQKLVHDNLDLLDADVTICSSVEEFKAELDERLAWFRLELQ